MMQRMPDHPKPSPGTFNPNNGRTNLAGRLIQPLCRFVRGDYITRDEAQAAFDRQRAHDGIGDRVMLWFAVLAVAALAGPTVVSELAFAPLVIFFFVRSRHTAGTWVHWLGQPMFLLVLLWTAWQATTLLWTGNTSLGLGELGQNYWVLVGGLLWPIIHKRRTILAALAIGFAVAHLAQLVQLVGVLNHDGTYDPLFHRDPRRISGWWDPVVGGTMLVGAVGLHLPAALFWRGRSRWFARAGLLAALLGVIATGSRGASLAAFALVLGSLLLMAWHRIRHGRAHHEDDTQSPRSRRRWLVPTAWAVPTVWVVPTMWVTIALAAAAGLWFAAGPRLASRVQQAQTELSQAAQGETNTDIGRRIDMADWSVRALGARPIRGTGAGGFRAWVESNGGPTVFDHAHNSALHIGATTGLVGLTIWAMLVVVVIRNGVIHRRSLGDPAGTSGPLFAILGLLLVSAFDVVHLNAQTGALLWVLAGVCVTWEPDPPSPRTTHH
ncbi:MAG: O-antigen ligase [Phycisphaerales bacterium]|jgi:O-antigen ligase